MIDPTLAARMTAAHAELLWSCTNATLAAMTHSVQTAGEYFAGALAIDSTGAGEELAPRCDRATPSFARDSRSTLPSAASEPAPAFAACFDPWAMARGSMAFAAASFQAGSSLAATFASSSGRGSSQSLLGLTPTNGWLPHNPWLAMLAPHRPSAGHWPFFWPTSTNMPSVSFWPWTVAAAGPQPGWLAPAVLSATMTPSYRSDGGHAVAPAIVVAQPLLPFGEISAVWHPWRGLFH